MYFCYYAECTYLEIGGTQRYISKISTMTKTSNHVKRTVEKHKDLIPSLIALHPISGCDTMPMMFGTGKAKALNAVKKCPLQLPGQEQICLSMLWNEGD